MNRIACCSIVGGTMLFLVGTLLDAPVDSLANAFRTITAPQPCCISSIWKKIKNTEIANTKEGRLTAYSEDAKKYAHHNTTIPTHKPNKRRSTLRIASYNVHFLNPEKEIFHVIQNLSDLGVDIICFQEFISTEKFIKNLQNTGYTKLFIHKSPNKYNNNLCIMIAAKQHVQIALISQGTLQHNTHDSGYLKTKITIDKNVIALLTTHLNSHSEQYRLEQMEQLHGFITRSKDKNVIIAADWNALQKKDYPYSIDGTPVWKILEKDAHARKKDLHLLLEDFTDRHGYTDAFQLARVVPSFTHWTGTTIDRFLIYRPENFTVKNAYIYFDDASDHLPVILDISIS